MVVAGMGGSAVGGALARAMLGDHASRPILASRTYGLPAWTTPDTTVLCASYSGNTEETLACYEAAGALGARRVAVTSGGRLAELARADGVPVIPVAGGFQPRAAVAYMTVAALEVARLCGAGPRMGAEIDVAADHLEQLVVEWGADGAEDSEAKMLARALHDSVPVHRRVRPDLADRLPLEERSSTRTRRSRRSRTSCPSSTTTSSSAGKTPPRSGASPRSSSTTATRTPRVKERIALTSELIGDQATSTHVIESRGRTTVERVFSLVLLGDLLSLYVAVLARDRPDAGRRDRDAEGAAGGNVGGARGARQATSPRARRSIVAASAQEPRGRVAIQRLLDGAGEHRLGLLCSEADPRRCSAHSRQPHHQDVSAAYCVAGIDCRSAHLAPRLCQSGEVHLIGTRRRNANRH